MSLHPEVKNYLDKLDREQRSFNSFDPEDDIAKKIQDLLFASNKKENYKLTDEDKAELIAFQFSTDTRNEQSVQGIYYVLDKTPVTEKRLDYWARRANKAQHPILSARYADLVVDFSPQITNKKANIELFHKVIDLNIVVCRENLACLLNCSIKIKRALYLAVLTNDQKRIEKVKEAMIALVKQAAKDINQTKVCHNRARICYGIFERLILDDNKRKVDFEDKEKSSLVEIMENILLRLSKKRKCLVIRAEAVCLLAEYYAIEKDQDNLMRVLDIYEKSMKAMKYKDSDAILKSFNYENIQQLYEKYRGFEKAKAAAARMIREVEDLDLNLDKSLNETSVETPIDPQIVDDLKRKIFGDENHKNDLQEVVLKIAEKFLISKSDMEKMFEKQCQEGSLMNSILQQIIAENGMSIAKLSGEEKDNDKHLIYQTSQYLAFQGFFLGKVMEELEQRFSAGEAIKCFKEIEFFNKEENAPLLEKALSRYWDKDYLSASHFFCPLIEAVVRDLAKEAKVSILKPNPHRGREYRSLGLLLNDSDKEIFSKINPGICFYLRIVLVEPLGMNLRNDWAHGSERGKFHQRTISDRLLHVIMVLFWISMKKNREKIC